MVTDEATLTTTYGIELYKGRKNHIVVLAFWAYSHFKPAVELVRQLSSEEEVDVHVTLVIEENSKIQGLVNECKAMKRVDVYLLPDSGGGDNGKRQHDLYLINLKKVAPVMLKEINDKIPLTSVVFEMFSAAALDAIKPYSIPHYAFFTVNKYAVQYLLASVHFPEHLELDPTKLALPSIVEKEQAREVLKNVSLMYHLNCRFRGSMFHPPPPIPEGTECFYFENECKTMCAMTVDAKAILVNSFPAFDQVPPVHYMKSFLDKFVSIGPLGMKPYEQVVKMKDDPAIKFLDSHPPNSVLYIAFGSEFRIKNEEVVELANALITADIPFIWAVHASQKQLWPADLLTDSANRLILHWAPQVDILNHPSTRCFLSHCGWNSCLEGLQAGLPFICWPIFAEQYINSVLLLDKGLGVMVQGCGLKLEKIVQASEITVLLDALFRDESNFDSYRVASLKLKSELFK